MKEAIFLTELSLYRAKVKLEICRDKFSRAKIGSRNWQKILGKIKSLSVRVNTLSELLTRFYSLHEGTLEIRTVSTKGKVVFSLKNSRDRRNSCEGKKVHGSLEEARAEAVRYFQTYGILMNAYECIHCDGSHIGHSPDELDIT